MISRGINGVDPDQTAYQLSMFAVQRLADRFCKFVGSISSATDKKGNWDNFGIIFHIFPLKHLL